MILALPPDEAAAVWDARVQAILLEAPVRLASLAVAQRVELDYLLIIANARVVLSREPALVMAQMPPMDVWGSETAAADLPMAERVCVPLRRYGCAVDIFSVPQRCAGPFFASEMFRVFSAPAGPPPKRILLARARKILADAGVLVPAEPAAARALAREWTPCKVALMVYGYAGVDPDAKIVVLPERERSGDCNVFAAAYALREAMAAA